MDNLSFVLAQHLKELRKSRGLSYAELSKVLQEKYEIQISKESLTNYEVSDANHTKARKNEGMSVKYLYYLADFYQVTTDYLLGIAKEPRRDESIQAVCKFTGLSANAVHAIKNCGGLIEVLDFLLETPDMYDLISKINDLAMCEGISSYLKSAENSALERYLFPDNGIYGSIHEKIDVFRYRLSVSFNSIFESIVERLLNEGGIHDMVQKLAEHYEEKEAIDSESKNEVKGDF